MDWVQTNWFWILIFGLFIAMHLFGHGGHGGGHQHAGRNREDETGDETQARDVNASSGGHHH